jgi:hypothetical protein
LRILIATSSVAIAAALAFPAMAADPPPVDQQTAQQATPPVVDQTTNSNDDANQIVVIATALRGAVQAPQPPIIELNEQDIASYGASSLADLVQQLSTETGSGRGRGSGWLRKPGCPVFVGERLRAEAQSTDRQGHYRSQSVVDPVGSSVFPAQQSTAKAYEAWRALSVGSRPPSSLVMRTRVPRERGTSSRLSVNSCMR